MLPNGEIATGLALCQNKSWWVELVVYSQHRLLVTKAKAASGDSANKLLGHKRSFEQRCGYVSSLRVTHMMCFDKLVFYLLFIFIGTPLCPIVHSLALEAKWPWARMPGSKHLGKFFLGVQPRKCLQSTCTFFIAKSVFAFFPWGFFHWKRSSHYRVRLDISCAFGHLRASMVLFLLGHNKSTGHF